MQLERMGKKSSLNLLAQIEESKHNDLSRVIFGLGIRHVGERTAQILAQHFGSMDALSKATQENLESVFEVGPVVAESIYHFFAQPENLSVVDKLRAAGVNLTAKAAARRSGELQRKAVRPDRQTSNPFSRAGLGVDRATRRPRDGFGEPKDRFRAGRRGCRIEARQSPSLGHRSDRRAGVPQDGWLRNKC